MNNRCIPTLAALMMAGIPAACAPMPSSTPADTATITETATTFDATATDTPQPTSTLQPSATPITYPMRLEQVGGFGGIADALALSGDRVYLKVGQRVVTVDVSNPYKPTMIGHSEILGEIVSVVMADGYIMAVGQDDVIWKLEASPGGNLVLIHTYTAPNEPDYPKVETPADVAEGDGYTFDYQPGWEYDVAVQPLTVFKKEETDEVRTAIGQLPDGEVAVSRDIVVRGQYVYTAATRGLSIYNLGIDPEIPLIWEDRDYRKTMWKEIGTLATDFGTFVYGCRNCPLVPDICVFDNHIYTYYAVWSLETPEDPALLANPISPRPRCGGFPVKDGMIYQHSDAGMYTFLDMSNPKQYTENPVNSGIDFERVIAVHKNLLIADSTQDEELILYALNIADPNHPKLLDNYAAQSRPARDSYMIIGDYLYNLDSFIALDISNPTQLKETTIPAIFPLKNQTLVYDDWVFRLTVNSLEVFGASDLLSPVTTLEISGIPGSLMFVGPYEHPSYRSGRLYVETLTDNDENNVLTIINIEDPTRPQVLATALLAPLQIASYGDYLYLRMGEQGIGIYKLVDN